jgi:hypothetical protein
VGELMKIFGIEFQPMNAHEYDMFAGAEEGSYIAYPSDDVILIHSPNGEITEIDAESGSEKVWVNIRCR